MYEVVFSSSYSLTVLFMLAIDVTLVWRLTHTRGFSSGQYWILVLLAATAMCAAFDVICVLLTPEAGRPMNYVANAMYNISFIFVNFVLFHRLERVAESQTFVNPVFRIVAYLPIVLLVVMLVVSYWTGLLFYVSDEGFYHRGPLYVWMVFVLGNSYIVLAVILAVYRNLKSHTLESREYLKRSVSFVLPILIGITFQAVITTVPGANMGLTFTMILVYLCSQDDIIAANERANARYQKMMEGLAMDFNAVYFVDFKKDTLVVVKHNAANNGTKYDDHLMKRHEGYRDVNKLYCEGAVVPEDREGYMQATSNENLMAQLNERGRMYYRYRVVPNPLDQEHIEMQVVKLNESDDSFEAVLGYRSIDDIIRSEREYQEKLENSLEQARIASLGKTSFLRRMSHDLRTPINGIMGMLDIADHYGNDPERQAECREKTREASEYLLSLINDVLDMNKLESGMMEVEKQVADLRRVFQGQTVIGTMTADDHGVAFIDQSDYEHMPHPWAYCCPSHIEHAVGNIVSNAIKYNHEGGKVLAKVEEVAFDGRIATMRVTVADNGIGMAPEYLEHAFEAFSQEKRDDVRTKYASTGLGLSLVKELVDLMDGTISVESEVGKGTKFTIDLPLEVAEAPEGHDDADALGDDGEFSVEGMHVLLVEDNDINMEIAEFMLQNEGMTVDEAWNGQEAVDMFEKSEPGTYDVIFMDVMMPVMDGLEASRTIRALSHPDAQSVLIFAMTANAFTDDVARSLEAGMNGHITKPLKIEHILDALAGSRKQAGERP